MKIELPEQAISSDNIKMFGHQISEIMKDPYFRLNSRLQMSLAKLCSRLEAVARNTNIDEIDGFYQLMGEMLCLFLSAKSHLELIADCNQNTDGQREAAKKAITEENSELFARKIIGVYENTKWHVLKNAPVNIEEIVEILQAYKTKYGKEWELENVLEMDDYIDINEVNEYINAAKTSYLAFREYTHPSLTEYKAALIGVIKTGGVVKHAKETYDIAQKKLKALRPGSSEHESVKNGVIKAGKLLGVAASSFNYAMHVFMATEVPKNPGKPKTGAGSSMMDTPHIYN